MKKIQWVMPLLMAAAMFLGASQTAAAQGDPPGRVARLNYIQGSVSFQVAGDQNWVQADPNRPLTIGDNLWSDKNSRGEVHIGSTAIRLSSETGISFLNLDDRTVQLQLAQGTIEVHLRHLAAGDAFEIDTPNLALTLARSGEYTMWTDPNGGSTVIIVREGEGQVTGGGESFDLRAGQQYTFNGSGTEELSYDAQRVPGFDDFEAWCQERDDRENRAQSARYVSRDIDGYYDLDDYGEWRPLPEYGQVWVPRAVPVGWAPYSYGHWVWIEPWGWTWVDDEPWGFAPFHYGRWVLLDGYWAWVPGPVVVRPVYAPALVAFVGGGGWSFSIAFGSGFAGVAWFPLGPRDVYIPAYQCSPHYFQNVNVTNTKIVNVTQVTNVYNTVIVNKSVTNVTNVTNYTYANNTKAITAVPKETFVSAKPVAAVKVQVTPQQLQSARVVQTAPLAPTRASYVAATAKPASAKPAVPFAQRPAVAKLNPAASINRRPPEAPINNRPTNIAPPARTPAARGGAAQPQENTGFKPFTPPNRVNTPAPGQPANPGATPPPSNNRNATPPPANNRSATPPSANNPAQLGKPANPNQAQPETPHPPVRFTPPVKAKDENYDVHPPLNKKPPEPPKRVEPPPRQENKPAPKAEEKPKPEEKAKPEEKPKPKPPRNTI